MRTLVTGGAGFIGSHLVDALLADGHEVRVFDDFSTGHRRNLVAGEDGVEVVEGDLRSYEQVTAAVCGCDAVFHQGALRSIPRSVRDPRTTNEVNVGGTLNVLLAARGAEVGRVVFASSSSVYGDRTEDFRQEAMTPRPLAPYAVSKLAGEHYCRIAHAAWGLPTVALRYFNVYGSRDDAASRYATVIPRFVSAALGEGPAQVHGDGEQSRDFTHVSDVVAANLLALGAKEASGRVFNVGSGRAHTVNELLALVSAIAGADVEPCHSPRRPGDVHGSRADLTLAREVLGYRPEVGLSAGLRATVEWYAEDGASVAAALEEVSAGT